MVTGSRADLVLHSEALLSGGQQAQRGGGELLHVHDENQMMSLPPLPRASQTQALLPVVMKPIVLDNDLRSLGQRRNLDGSHLDLLVKVGVEARVRVMVKHKLWLT